MDEKKLFETCKNAYNLVKKNLDSGIEKELKSMDDVIIKIGNTAIAKVKSISEDKAVFDSVVDYLVDNLTIDEKKKIKLKNSLYLRNN